MTTAHFITKQHVKYYWKVMSGGSRHDTTDVYNLEPSEDAFWQYEQTPRDL